MSRAPRPLPEGLRRHPDLDTWIRIDAGSTITLRTGKVEIGQWLRSAIARIGAEELDVALGRIRVEMADTGEGPDEGITAGSASLEQSGSAVRAVAAEARHHLLALAAERLGVPAADLRVEDGRVLARGGEWSITYWELAGGRPFARQVSGQIDAKPSVEHRIVGRPGPRIDLRAKLTGGAFLQDLAPPGLRFGRIARAPSRGARLLDADEAGARALPGAPVVVRRGSFLGVIAQREEQAVRACQHLRDSARWEESAVLPPESELYAHMLSLPRRSFPVVDAAAVDAPVEPCDPPADAAATLHARYLRPYQMHASIGPSAALARLDGEQLTVWTHSQGVGLLRRALAQVLAMAPEQLRVIHADGAGCYGHNGADDVALDAALLARALPGVPVQVQWSREDEHACEPYGPAMIVDLQGSLDAAGRVIDWSHEVSSHTHFGRALPLGRRSNLLAAWDLDPPFGPAAQRPALDANGGIHRNAQPIYAFPRVRVVKHFVERAPLRVSALRGLGSYANLFAIESFMDELAERAGADPLAFRLAHLQDPRARAVLEAAAQRAHWRGPAQGGRGQGLAVTRYKNAKAYAALVVDVEVDVARGAIRLLRAVIAADAGEIVDPDGLTHQLEGGFVQAASWTLKEAVHFDARRVTSRDWGSYPILTFQELPETIETVLIDRPGTPFLGAGEVTQGVTPAAIANAVAHACGLRLREIPFTPQRVVQESERARA